jgi:Tfp pilus assembly PilM family ATPase
VDFGALSITVSIIKGKNIVFSQNINSGSYSLTQTIAKDYNLSLAQAEQYKKIYGLTNQIGGKIFNSLNPVMQIIINEINKIINYVNINLAEYIPQRYVIIGQGSLLPGLQEYLVRSLGRNFELIDPIVGSFSYSEKVKAELTKSTGLGYSVAVGLALKEN